ncbi:formylglycine-generating enzyme family protein [bacterium]|nr:formylglycine-generating enzyme family protein [bacterium]MDB4508395.1 formylglycine-generating enzyme family protein [Akkermansiaceae bacterium]
MSKNLFNVAITALAVTSCCEDETNEFIFEKPTLKVATKQKELSPGSVTLVGDGRPEDSSKFFTVTEKIYAQLKPLPKKMEAYTETVPLSDNTKFDLIPIPGGEFKIGSPDSEASRNADEGPQKTVKIAPFWMAKTETTWAMYRAFMENGQSRNKDGTLNHDGDIYSHDPPFRDSKTLVDAVSQPTPPYMPMHFSLGDNAGYGEVYPALAPTQHAASKFCEWLTAQTGHYYRLPTEAEWEYACRAGTTTAYSFGDDESELGDYAWYYDNSEETYHPVGEKKPNPFGLHDMHGNVSEWTLAAYLPDYAAHPAGAFNPLPLTEKRYPRVARGGHWDADAQDLRSAVRQSSKSSWKMTDPQNPKSIWYHTDTQWLGFRIIRPAKTPSVEEMHLLWNTGPGKL